MGTILVLAHEYDLFHERHFLVAGLFPHWRAMGHDVVVRAGLHDLPPADLAILHVDSTIVPEPYVEAIARYPKVVNAGVLDVGKRRFSQNIVGPFDAWSGPVVVKTNANAGGIPERVHAELARQRAAKGAAADGPTLVMTGRYPIFPSRAHVPPRLALHPEVVIEKFLPERCESGYASRHWVFFGSAERCNRVTGPHPIVKGRDVTSRSPVEVPSELREWRSRLGFDFGKFDFVLHGGRTILLDVNRTPTLPANLS
ncbi:MAG TPA: hypothetical protein VM580_22795, partial [Labilithrix sp.]|nr:hypothetical protein [Labilithrix sp.]